MSEHPLQLDKQDHVAIVTLDRPEKLNALSSALQTALQEAVTEIRDDDQVRVAITVSYTHLTLPTILRV